MTNAAFWGRGSRPVPRRAERPGLVAWAPRLLIACVIATGAHAGTPAAPLAARLAGDHVQLTLRHGESDAAKFVYLYTPPARWAGAVHWRYNPTNAPAPFADTAATVARLQASFDQWT